MLLTALSALMADSSHHDLAAMVLVGDLPSAIRLGSERLERLDHASDAAHGAALGQLLGRLLLASGRSEDAEDVFQRQLRRYEALAPRMVRWHGGADQAAMLIHLNRLDRAVECGTAVADDARAPAEVRIEAMAITALAMYRSGDCSRALTSIDVATSLARTLKDGRVAELLECMTLELTALHRERSDEALSDHALGGLFGEGRSDVVDLPTLRHSMLRAAESAGQWSAMVAVRLRHLARMLSGGSASADAAASVSDLVAWLHERRIFEEKTLVCIEGALMLIGRGCQRAAADLLAPLTSNEQQVRHSRHALELQYCMFKIHQQQGRQIDALRLYRQHTQSAVHAVQTYMACSRNPAFLQQFIRRDAGDSTKMRLPLRYRQAYQYLIDHLADEDLSVRRVAGHIGVTERSLQLAFRTHLGATPAELIRTRRVERIHEELKLRGGDAGVLEVASRWGLRNRSTLVCNYRLRFDETPRQTACGVPDPDSERAPETWTARSPAQAGIDAAVAHPQ